MAFFYGTLRGRAANRVSRIAHPRDELTATLAARDVGAVDVCMYKHQRSGRVIVEVREIPWDGRGRSAPIWTGTIGDLP